MARQQFPQGFSVTGIIPTPAVPLSATSLIVPSFIVQAPSTNADFIKLGNSTGRFYMIAPGKDLAINGDNLDNGTTAYTDLADWYVEAVSGTQDCSVTYLEGL